MQTHKEAYPDYIQDPWSSSQGNKRACVHGWVDPLVRDEVFTGISQAHVPIKAEFIGQNRTVGG